MLPFVDVTVEAGLPTDSSPCVVFDDLDGDRAPDLLVGGSLDGANVGLFRNRRDGTFEPVPLALSEQAEANVCASGDFTNDGLVDLVIGHVPRRGGIFRVRALTLLRNAGRLVFEDASDLAPPDVPREGFVTTVSLVDFDGDGWLDLYAGMVHETALMRGAKECGPVAAGDDFFCRVQKVSWTPGLLLRNERGKAFTWVADPPVNPRAVVVNAVGLIDWDEDGLMDVLVSNDFASNNLFRNVDGAGAFEDLAPGLGMHPYNHAMGTAFGDFDGDGTWDVYVADLGTDRFYFGSGDGTWTDRARELRVADWTRVHSGWSPLAADLDLDGSLDLYVVNTALMRDLNELARIGMNQTLRPSVTQADFVYLNDGRGRFSLGTVPHREGKVPSVFLGAAAAADYDGDGDLDIAEMVRVPDQFRLLRNDLETRGHWLVVWIEGADASAVGAEVTAWVGGEPRARRVLHGSTGSVGQSWHALHFGLGQAESVDALDVRWPDGTTQREEGPMRTDAVLRVERR